MARDFTIAGESLVLVKGNVNTLMSSVTQLGLPAAPIRVRPEFRHKDLKVDAWGEAPPEIQFMLAWVNITMDLIHVDMNVLDAVLQESMGGAAAIGQLTRAGTRMGGGGARFSPTYHFVGLNIAAPVSARPWRFLHSYLTGPPIEHPVGTEASVITCNWRAIPYISDPANIVGGIITGATNVPLWDHVLDN